MGKSGLRPGWGLGMERSEVGVLFGGEVSGAGEVIGERFCREVVGFGILHLGIGVVIAWSGSQWLCLKSCTRMDRIVLLFMHSNQAQPARQPKHWHQFYHELNRFWTSRMYELSEATFMLRVISLAAISKGTFSALSCSIFLGASQ